MDTTKPIRIVGIGGSTRQGSQSLLALKAVLSLAEAAGAQTVLADVRELNLPMYNSELKLEQYPQTLAWLIDEVRQADAFIACSPTYHGTVSGAVKNVFDCLDLLGSGYFGTKPFGLMAVGGGALNVINGLHHTVRALNGMAIPIALGLAHSPINEATGQFSDEGTAKRAVQMIDQLTNVARCLRQ